MKGGNGGQLRGGTATATGNGNLEAALLKHEGGPRGGTGGHGGPRGATATTATGNQDSGVSVANSPRTLVKNPSSLELCLGKNV